MSISRKIIALLVFGASIFLGYVLVSPSPKTPSSHELKTVEVVTVTVKPIQQTAQLIGKIQSQQTSVLTAQSSGTLAIVTAAGKTVKQRDLLAKIDNINVERNYQLAQQEEKLAKLQYQRVKQLLDDGILSKNAVEEKESAWIRAQEKVSTERIARDKLMITAPFDGVVGAFKFEQDAQVKAGDTVVPVYNPAKLMVKFDIPLPLVPAIHNGSVVIVNDKPYLLTHWQQMLDDETHMSPATAKIECSRCIIGESIAVQLVVASKKAAVVIPYEAVFIRDGKRFVYKVDQGKTILTAVTLGIHEQESVEIVAGLKAQDKIIVRGQARLSPGESVTPSYY